MIIDKKKIKNLLRVSRYILAYVFALAVPLCLKFLLSSEVSIVCFTAIVWGKTTLVLLSHLFSRRILSFLSSVYTVLFAVFILIGILITPYTAYDVWFRSVSANSARGSISTLFVLLACFFSSSFSGLFFTLDVVLPFLAVGTVVASLAAVIFQNTVFYAIASSFLLFCLFYCSVRFGLKGSRIRIFSFSLVIVACASLFAVLFSNIFDPDGSGLVDDTLHPGLRKTISTVFPQFPLVYGLAGYGTSFNQKRLGGAPVLSNAPVFAVELLGGHTGSGRTGSGRTGTENSSIQVYLKTRTYDFYDGISWKTTFLRDNRPVEGNTVFDEGSFQIDSESWIRVTIMQDYYNLIPHTLETTRFLFDDSPPAVSSRDIRYGYIVDPPMNYGDSVVLLQESNLNEEAPFSLELLSEDQGIGEGEEAFSDRFSEYLQIPKDISDALVQVALRLRAPDGDFRATLKRIETYLATRFTYDLEAEYAGMDQDFIEHFLLEAQRGYCVHFASSFILLARLNGIPARYVTGFMVQIPSGEQRSVVTGLSAHAWPEIWLDENGWETWEATATFNPEYFDALFEDFYDFDIAWNRLTARQLTNILGIALEENLTGRRTMLDLGKTVSYVVFVLLGIAGLLFAVRIFIFLGVYRLRNDIRTVFRIAQKYVEKQKRRGLPTPQAVGWVNWNHRLMVRHPELSHKITRLQKILLSLVYGNDPIGNREVRYLLTFFRKYRNL